MDPAIVLSIKISPDSSLLAATSDKSTLHVFDISAQTNPRIGHPQNTSLGSVTRRQGSASPKSTPGTGRGVSPVPAGLTGAALPLNQGSASPSIRGASPSSDYIIIGTSPPRRSSGSASQRYGKLSNLSFLPRMFTDPYSVASAQFDVGYTAAHSQNAIDTLPGPSRRGVVGWLDRNKLIVLRADPTAMWEKFRIDTSDDGRSYLARTAWKNYLPD